MESNLWDDELREMLGEYKPGKEISSVEQTHDVNPSYEDASDPDAIEETNLSPDKLEGWKRIEASLEAADHAFDETVRHRLNHFHPKYDPNSWTVFLKRFATQRQLRTKLVLLKSFEVAVLLLLLLTAVNMGRHGKLPFESNFSNQSILATPQATPHQPLKSTTTGEDQTAPAPKPNPDFTQAIERDQPHTITLAGIDSGRIAPSSQHTLATSSEVLASVEQTTSNPSTEATQTHTPSAIARNTNYTPVTEIAALNAEVDPGNTTHASVPDFQQQYHITPTDPIASAELTLSFLNVESIPHPKFVKQASRRYTEFSVLTQVDYNALRMPEDRLYSSGRQIIFPSQGIYSPGFGAGFTVAIGHPRWALETGVIYNAKNFKPGRQLIVGGAFDNGTVEFEAMKLQVLSMPFQFRYRMDHQGRFKAYAMAGAGFNVIAQSDIDVQIKYHFASLSFGENPNNDPNLAMTIEETRRLREHIRDGAPLSTKTFVSANAGLGVEYMITEHKMLFFQSSVQYQIPNVSFSNNNGKHLRSVSLQAGIRGPLGK